MEGPPHSRLQIVPSTEVDDAATAQVGTRRVATPLTGPPVPPATIGRFIVLEQLGSGGMGTVFAAYDPRLDRKVAIKVVNEPTKLARHRLLREAQAMAQLSHPNVVPIFEADEHGDQIYVAMEFIDGRTLGETLRREQLPHDQILDLFVRAGRGLSAAHEAGLVHRDFKPDNVMVGRDGRVRVMDFGLVRGTDITSADADAFVDGDDGPVRTPVRMPSPQFLDKLTGVGRAMGTPRYMAPEQFTGAPVDHRTDLYAFCVALYEALYGAAPFRADNLKALAAAVSEGRRQPLTDEQRDSVPPWLARTIHKGMAVDPNERWTDMTALLEALAPKPVARRRGAALMVSLALVAVMAVGGVIAVVSDRGEASATSIVSCDALPSRVVAAWSIDRRQAITSAFAGDDAAFVGPAVNLAVVQLERYARTLDASASAACVAYHEHASLSDDEFERAQRCIDRGVAGLDTLSAALGRGDRRTLEHLDHALASLPDVDACRRRDDFAGIEDPPSDADVDEAAAIRVEMAELRMQAAVGQRDQLTASLDDLDARAGALGHPPLQAEVELLRLEIVPSTPAAHAMAVGALERARRVDNQRLESKAVLALARLDGGGSARETIERRRAWLRYGASRVDEASDPELHIAMATERATLEQRAANFDAALRAADQALAVAQEAYQSPDIRIGRAHTTKAIAHMWRNEMDAALEQITRARNEFSAVVGPDHPLMAETHELIADQFQVTGHHRQAIDSYARALAILRAAYGETSNEAMHILPSLAIAHDLAGETSAARDLLVEYLIGRGEFDGAGSADGVQALNSLCFVQLRLDDLDAAARACEAARRRIHEVFPDPHPFHAVIGNNEAMIARARQQYERALELDTLALDRARASVGPDHPTTAYSHIGLGLTLRALNRGDEARAHFERAYSIREQADVDPAERGEAECLLASAVAATDPSRARALASRGLQRPGGDLDVWKSARQACHAVLALGSPSDH